MSAATHHAEFSSRVRKDDKPYHSEFNPRARADDKFADARRAVERLQAAHLQARRSPAGEHLWRSIDNAFADCQRALRAAPIESHPNIAASWIEKLMALANTPLAQAQSMAFNAAHPQPTPTTVVAAPPIDALRNIATLASRGITLRAIDGTIEAAPAGLLNDSDRELLKTHRAAILLALESKEQF